MECLKLSSNQEKPYRKWLAMLEDDPKGKNKKKES